jgi:hypothetical protein
MRAGGDIVYGDSATVVYGLCIDDVDVFRAMILHVITSPKEAMITIHGKCVLYMPQPIGIESRRALNDTALAQPYDWRIASLPLNLGHDRHKSAKPRFTMHCQARPSH